MRWGLVAVAVIGTTLSLFSATARANSVTELSLPSDENGWLVVDGTNEHVFVTGGTGSTGIVVLDFDGNVVTTITGEEGASGMALDDVSGTLYVALADGDAISKIDTTTLAETSRISVDPFTAPSHLALAGGKLWFTYSCQSGGAASIDLDGSNAVDETDLPGYCAIFATTPAAPDLLAAADTGLSPFDLFVFDVSTGSPSLVTSVSTDSSYLKDLDVTPDGLNVLAVSGSPYVAQSFLASDLTPGDAYSTGAYPAAASISDDGAWVAAGAQSYSGDDILVYPVGETTPVRSWDFGSDHKLLVIGALAFSPDASRLFATSTNDFTGHVDFRVYTSPTVGLLASTTSLTSTASTVTIGNSVTLKAHVTGPTTGAVRLFAQPYGEQKLPIKTGALNTYGNVSFSVKPTKKTVYSAEFVEDETYATSASPNRTVNVRSRTTVALAGFYGISGAYKLYRLGKQVHMRGTVAPNHEGKGLKFAIQNYRSGAWRTIITRTYPIEFDGSSYAVFWTNYRGLFRFHCVFGGDADHLGSTSTWKYFRFT